MTSDLTPAALADLHDLFWNTESIPSPAVVRRRWRRLQFHIETVMSTRGLLRLEAGPIAYENLLVELLNETHPDTDPNRCAHCGGLETPSAPLLPIGAGARHVWAHSNCWSPWRERRRTEAIAELAAMGIASP